MAVKQTEGGVVITGKHTMLMRYASLKIGLNLEARTNGRMKMTRGPSCKSIVLAEFAGEKELLKNLGIKLNRNTSYEDLVKIVEAKRDAVAAMASAQEAAAQAM